MVQVKVAPNTSKNIILKKFDALKENQFRIGNTSAQERRNKLIKLHKAILKYQPQIHEAMYNDFKKHPAEVDLGEIYPITSEIKFAKKKMWRWIRNHRVPTPLAMLGASSFIKYEPKGVVMIISPWNFPFMLTLCPLVSAIAAGNTVMIKPSEYCPHSSALLKKMIDEVFEENEVTVVEGGLETAKDLLKLPFNHIFFTGAPSVGKIVMEAASKHLTSVTLELGGKSPTIVDETADIDTAARRIVWCKYINNGQVCIAPDYIYVHEKVVDEFVEKVKGYIQSSFNGDASKETSYNRIINSRHFNRLKSYVDDAVLKGGNVKEGAKLEKSDNYISPTVITDMPDDSKLMQEEVFGPIMPVRSFSNLTDIVKQINAKEKPLALYIYSKHRKNIDYVLNNTRAGGSAINHNAIQFFNPNLPFGGVNNSGIGKSRGWYGFQAFSNARGIAKQHLPNALDLLLPPYNDFKKKLIALTIKWF